MTRSSVLVRDRALDVDLIGLTIHCITYFVSMK